jgi:hypothetical protein
MIWISRVSGQPDTRDSIQKAEACESRIAGA